MISYQAYFKINYITIYKVEILYILLILYHLKFYFIFYLFIFLIFWDRVSLYSPGCPGTYSVDQSGLELRNPPASASQVLGLKACTTTTRLHQLFFYCSELFSLFWVFLPFQMNFRIALFMSLKNCLGILMRIALDL